MLTDPHRQCAGWHPEVLQATYYNLEDTVPARFPMTRGLEYEPLASVSNMMVLNTYIIYKFLFQWDEFPVPS